jgi:hypothetical protein
VLAPEPDGPNRQQTHVNQGSAGAESTTNIGLHDTLKTDTGYVALPRGVSPTGAGCLINVRMRDQWAPALLIITTDPNRCGSMSCFLSLLRGLLAIDIQAARRPGHRASRSCSACTERALVRPADSVRRQLPPVLGCSAFLTVEIRS